MTNSYTFNDVNIIPKYSAIMSRNDCNPSVMFLGQKLDIPVIPSNMQTVTGEDMLVAMNEINCIGVMHRFNGWKNELKTVTETREFNSFRYAASVGVNNTEEDLDFFI